MVEYTERLSKEAKRAASGASATACIFIVAGAKKLKSAMIRMITITKYLDEIFQDSSISKVRHTDHNILGKHCGKPT